MKKTLLLALSLLAIRVCAQDTLYYDADFRVLTSIKDAVYMKIIKCAADNPIKCSVSTFQLSNNQIISNWRYSDYPNKVCHGRCNRWGADGTMIFELTYINGKRQGQEKSFYPNGKLMRLLNWDQDTLVNASLFNEDGSPKPIQFKEDIESADYQIEPMFPGGLREMYTYLARTVNYPEYMKENGISGGVILTFVIEKDGSIGPINVLRTPHKLASDELSRAIKAMPKWRPGRVNDEPVKVRYTMSFNFKLD
ncbi:MAG TPA: energy transducer TonB [Saprospiraceae bacterium]|nr:energy transducer TonB [Saprospiraceae bacterium]